MPKLNSQVHESTGSPLIPIWNLKILSPSCWYEITSGYDPGTYSLKLKCLWIIPGGIPCLLLSLLRTYLTSGAISLPPPIDISHTLLWKGYTITINFKQFLLHKGSHIIGFFYFVHNYSYSPQKGCLTSHLVMASTKILSFTE